jgi:hypothetical protein
MRNSTPNSLWLRPEVARRKESEHRGERRKGEIKFAKGSGQLTLSSRITKVQSKEKMKITTTSLAEWNLRMVDLDKKGRAVRDLPTKISLITKGDTEGSPSMMSLVTATVTRRWKI